MYVTTVEVRLAGGVRRMRNDRRPGTAPADLGAVFDSHATALYRTILAYTGGRSDVAEDAVGEAFARATAHVAEIRDLVPWLYRVAFNVATDELRRDRHRADYALEDRAHLPPETLGLFEVLRHLPPRERAAMALFYVDDLPVADVAARMGVAAATVRVHLMKGRRRLRDLLGDEEVDE
jgi:RNA polymerase sigma-70 factor, ECF subfamily